MCKVFLAKARFVRRILACMVNFASNERYGGEGLRERLMEQGLKLPLSHPRPQVRLSFPPPPPSLPVENHLKNTRQSRFLY